MIKSLNLFSQCFQFAVTMDKKSTWEIIIIMIMVRQLPIKSQVWFGSSARVSVLEAVSAILLETHVQGFALALHTAFRVWLNCQRLSCVWASCKCPPPSTLSLSLSLLSPFPVFVSLFFLFAHTKPGLLAIRATYMCICMCESRLVFQEPSSGTLVHVMADSSVYYFYFFFLYSLFLSGINSRRTKISIYIHARTIHKLIGRLERMLDIILQLHGTQKNSRAHPVFQLRPNTR